MTTSVGKFRQRRSGAALFSLGLFAWAFATVQPCCEALAASAPHEHPVEQHSRSLHHQALDAKSMESTVGVHAHCIPHSLAAIDSAHGFAALEGPRSQEANDGADAVRPADAWVVASAARVAPPGLPPPGDAGARTYLRFQRFLE